MTAIAAAIAPIAAAIAPIAAAIGRRANNSDRNRPGTI
jgi:hypothetical protein